MALESRGTGEAGARSHKARGFGQCFGLTTGLAHFDAPALNARHPHLDIYSPAGNVFPNTKEHVHV